MIDELAELFIIRAFRELGRARMWRTRLPIRRRDSAPVFFAAGFIRFRLSFVAHVNKVGPSERNCFSLEQHVDPLQCYWRSATRKRDYFSECASNLTRLRICFTCSPVRLNRSSLKSNQVRVSLRHDECNPLAVHRNLRGEQLGESHAIVAYKTLII